MVFVEICVGSSCHIKGAPEIVELMQKAVSDNGLENEVILSGSFCTGQCNRIGVTVTVNDEICTGITRDNFKDLWENKIMKAVKAEG